MRNTLVIYSWFGGSNDQQSGLACVCWCLLHWIVLLFSLSILQFLNTPSPRPIFSVSDVRSLSNIYSLHLRGCICQSQGLPQWVSVDLFPLSFPAFPQPSFSCSFCRFMFFPFFCPQRSIIFTSSLCFFSYQTLSCLPSLSLSLSLKCFTCLIGLFRRRAHYLQLEGAECRIMGNIWGLISAACLKGSHHCTKSHTNTLTHTDRDSTIWQSSAKAFQLGSCILTG